MRLGTERILALSRGGEVDEISTVVGYDKVRQTHVADVFDLELWPRRILQHHLEVTLVVAEEDLATISADKEKVVHPSMAGVILRELRLVFLGEMVVFRLQDTSVSHFVVLVTVRACHDQGAGRVL